LPHRDLAAEVSDEDVNAPVAGVRGDHPGHTRPDRLDQLADHLLEVLANARAINPHLMRGEVSARCSGDHAGWWLQTRPTTAPPTSNPTSDATGSPTPGSRELRMSCPAA
jgi:hypothetical protein